MSRAVLLFFLLLTTIAGGLRADSSGVGPNLAPGDFETGTPTYDPWGGVDDLGNLHVWTGTQNAVSDSGAVVLTPFSPSVTVGDLNGDGLLDLVIADARGFFWYYQNSGTPEAPVFTHGEIIPIWLTLGYGDRDSDTGDGKQLWEGGDYVPRMQLVDFTGEGKLSIVTGTYLGTLYYIHNTGAATSPSFHIHDRAENLVPTHTKGLLWCNYLAPFLYDWTGTGKLDLVMGDGSYSANSIYFLTNMGSNDRPIFNESHRQKLIPGMGREHLTPQVFDWNGDGKPDIIAGERQGYINVYLNQAADKTAPPVFDMDKPQHVMFGSIDKLAGLPTLAQGDLNHDKLFDLVVGTVDGKISYAINTGTATAPKFGPLVPFKGVNPFPKIVAPLAWVVDRSTPNGSPYELIECVNHDIEPTFVPPPDFKGKGAMKFSIVKPKNVYFNDVYVPDNMTRMIDHVGKVDLVAEKRYVLSFWERNDGNISDLVWSLEGFQHSSTSSEFRGYRGNPMSTGSTWTRVTDEVRIPNMVPGSRDPKDGGTFFFKLLFKGDGTVYLDDITLKAAEL